MQDFELTIGVTLDLCKCVCVSSSVNVPPTRGVLAEQTTLA